MGSTLLAGLGERLGFCNSPLRKTGLSMYVMGEKTLESGYMEYRPNYMLDRHSKPLRTGGVSVLDRNSQSSRTIVDISRVEKELGKIEAGNIQDLYLQCRNLYCKAVTYKEIKTRPDWHIELTTDIHRYNHKALYQAYGSHFDDVRMIHLHRPFAGWINSLASQAFTHPDLINRVKFFPHLRYADYELYEQAVAEMPGMDMQFDDLFEIPVEDLAANIANFLDVEMTSENLRNTEYDLYGRIIPYKVAFKKFDDDITFLSAKTRSSFIKLIEKNKLHKIPYSFIAWLRYIYDMLKFNISSHGRRL